MKKSLFIFSIIATLCLLSHRVEAQNRIGFGIRGGANFAQINDLNADTNNLTGFMLGLYINAPIYKNILTVQPEVLYTQKGFDFPGSSSPSSTYRIDYVEIPVLLRINIPNPTRILPFVYGGPYIGFKTNTDFPRVAADGSGFIDSQIKNKEVGITVGGGLEVSHINIGVRYDKGLTHVIEHTDATNGVFSIVAGIGL